MTLAKAPQKLILCIPSYCRPRMLASCLAAVGGVRIPADLRMEIVVVDNDIGGSAKAICDVAVVQFPLHYFIEPERGLVCVRNRALVDALALGADWIAFLDDDELPIPQWIEHLYAGAMAYGADIACGPTSVIVGQWALPREYAIPSKRQTGDPPHRIGAGNVLFSARLPGELGLRFDPRFNFGGGEDHDYFMQARERGCAAVWVNEALIFEMFTAERTSLRGQFFRGYMGGISRVNLFRKRAGALRASVHFALRIVGKALSALLHLLLGMLLWRRCSRHWRKAVAHVAAALGHAAGLLGAQNRRYLNPDGE